MTPTISICRHNIRHVQYIPTYPHVSPYDSIIANDNKPALSLSILIMGTDHYHYHSRFQEGRIPEFLGGGVGVITGESLFKNFNSENFGHI